MKEGKHGHMRKGENRKEGNGQSDYEVMYYASSEII